MPIFLFFAAKEMNHNFNWMNKRQFAHDFCIGDQLAMEDKNNSPPEMCRFRTSFLLCPPSS